MPEQKSQIPVERWVWRDAVMFSQMTPGVKVAAYAIADRANPCCFEKYANIANRCNMTERGVRAAVASLIDAGFITAKKTRFGGTNELRLSWPAGFQQSGTAVPDSDQSVTPMTDSKASNPSQPCPSIRHGDDGQSGMGVTVEPTTEPSTDPSTEEQTRSEGENGQVQAVSQPAAKIDDQTEVRFSGIEYPTTISTEEWPSQILLPGPNGECSAKTRIARTAANFLGYTFEFGARAPRWPDGRYADEAVMDAIPSQAQTEIIQRCVARKLTTGDLYRAIAALGIPKAANPSCGKAGKARISISN